MTHFHDGFPRQRHRCADYAASTKTFLYFCQVRNCGDANLIFNYGARSRRLLDEFSEVHDNAKLNH